MRNRSSARAVLAALLAARSLLPMTAAGQTRAPASNATESSWTPDRTPWGDPELHGTWTNLHVFGVPLEAGRPNWPPGARSLPDELALIREGQGGTSAGYSEREQRAHLGRTSLIVDPPTGIIPPLTPAAQKRAEARAEKRRSSSPTGSWDGPTDSWEDRNLWERCITRGMPGSMLPRSYNANYQILQTPGYVVILYEMIHDARIIPLHGAPHVSQNMQLWHGDPRGRWEGDTLVVETTNFNDNLIPKPLDKYNVDLMVLGVGKNGRLIERFRRVDADTIDYQFTVDDPTEYSTPWTAAFPLKKTESLIFEYACHEGNYGLRNILSAARADEKAEKAGR